MCRLNKITLIYTISRFCYPGAVFLYKEILLIFPLPLDYYSCQKVTADLIQETNPNPICWALDIFSPKKFFFFFFFWLLQNKCIIVSDSCTTLCNIYTPATFFTASSLNRLLFLVFMLIFRLIHQSFPLHIIVLEGRKMELMFFLSTGQVNASLLPLLH